VLHWRWIVNVISGRPRAVSGYRLGLGVVGLIATIALAISPLLAPVERKMMGKGAIFVSSHKNEGILIQGSMTLKDIEKTFGIPAVYIIESLKLPESISAEQQLGQLKRKYDIEIKVWFITIASFLITPINYGYLARLYLVVFVKFKGL